MKKIIAYITAAAMLAATGLTAAAESRTLAIDSALADESEIHILYNDIIVQYEDVRPVNYSDRVLIPFRAALENMGATVDYYDETRLVEATKGDTTIKFTLLDDTIYINNNGVDSSITMDVPMIIVEDRTLVPIRFMSEALGMQVGWDGNTETVVIMDYDDYFEEFEDIAPNLTKLSALRQNSAFNKRSAEFKLDFDKNGFAAIASGSADSVTDEGKSNTDLTVTVESDKINLKNTSLSLITDGGTVYMSSDALKKLAAGSDSIALKAAAVLAGGGKWYSIDLEKLLVAFGVDEQSAGMIVNAIQLGGSFDIKTLLTKGITTEGEAVFSEVVSLASQMDVYEALDKYIAISERSDRGYSVSVKLEPADVVEIVNLMFNSLMDDETKQALASMMNISVEASAENDGKSQKTEAEIAVDMIGSKFNLTFSGTAEDSGKSASVTVPESSTDVTEIILSVLD